MQRVTKYGLLLRTVLGKTADEEERLALENMVNVAIMLFEFLMLILFQVLM